MSASYNKVNVFVADISNKKHNLGSDQITVALTNTAPTSASAVLSDITEISYSNCSSRNVTTTSSTQSSGLYKLILQALTLTATGSVGPFRYVVVYNSTASGGPLIGYFDYGSAVTLAASDTFIISFDGTNGVLQIT